MMDAGTGDRPCLPHRRIVDAHNLRGVGSQAQQRRGHDGVTVAPAGHVAGCARAQGIARPGGVLVRNHRASRVSDARRPRSGHVRPRHVGLVHVVGRAGTNPARPGVRKPRSRTSRRMSSGDPVREQRLALTFQRRPPAEERRRIQDASMCSGTGLGADADLHEGRRGWKLDRAVAVVGTDVA